MNFIVAIAFFATVAISLERAFYDALLPMAIFLSVINLPLAIGHYFMKNESLNEHGVFCLIKGAKHLSPQQLKEAMFSARAAQDSLEAAGLFCWLMTMFLLATESYTASTTPLYLYNSIMAIGPVAIYLVFEGLFRILVNRGLAAASHLQQNSFLSWFRLVILLFLIVVIGFPDETDDASIILSGILPVSLLLFFAFRFVKSKLFVKKEVQQ